jgi:drug/metabolite transporter (DMT)-like permease
MWRVTRHLWKSALGLLLVTGSLLGLTPPLGKMATESGISPIVWAYVISAGAGSALLFVVLWRRIRLHLTTHTLRYFTIGATKTTHTLRYFTIGATISYAFNVL